MAKTAQIIDEIGVGVFSLIRNLAFSNDSPLVGMLLEFRIPDKRLIYGL